MLPFSTVFLHAQVLPFSITIYRPAAATCHCVARKLDVDLPDAVCELKDASTPALPAVLR